MIDWDMYKLDKITNEAHDDESETDSPASLQEFCVGRFDEREYMENRRTNLFDQAWCICL